MTSSKLVKLKNEPIKKEEIHMKSKLLVKLGASAIALSLIAACGTDDNQDPAEDEAPMQEQENNNDQPADDNGGANENDQELQDEDNGNTNGNGDMMEDQDKQNEEGNQ